MLSYAVVWQNGEEKPHSGRLDLTETTLFLEGGNRNNEMQVEIPYDDILSVERHSRNRVGTSRAITICSRNAGELLVASVGGAGLLGEIFTTLQQALGV